MPEQDSATCGGAPLEPSSPPLSREPTARAREVEEPATLEVLLPSQYFCRRPPSRHPERRLMIAVLHEALMTFAHGLGASGRPARRHLSEAEAWFASDEVRHPFSFVAICDALELDPSYLRAGLARWRASRPPRHRRRRRTAMASTPAPPCLPGHPPDGLGSSTLTP